ncbi:MAG: hypothetical protein KDN05_11265, partial [Verrucomicrobiae bacterium]|nr:hypothetical protein [Verrucomicrobiae bacterium]
VGTDDELHCLQSAAALRGFAQVVVHADRKGEDPLAVGWDGGGAMELSRRTSRFILFAVTGGGIRRKSGRIASVDAIGIRLIRQYMEYPIYYLSI